MSIDLFDDVVDDASVTEMRVGQIGTVRGLLEAVRYGDRRSGPGIVVRFADWGMLAIEVESEAAARSIPFRINEYVCVKVQCVDEDATVQALAIWQMGGGGVPLPLGEPMP